MIRVFDNVQKREYAEKIISYISSDIDLKNKSNEAARCFEKMKELKHENLVRYDNMFVKDGQAHLLMELSEKGSLK